MPTGFAVSENRFRGFGVAVKPWPLILFLLTFYHTFPDISIAKLWIYFGTIWKNANSGKKIVHTNANFRAIGDLSGKVEKYGGICEGKGGVTLYKEVTIKRYNLLETKNAAGAARENRTEKYTPRQIKRFARDSIRHH